ncbi:N-acetylmuramoyl-L-alanine amidase [Desulfitispora alkaliphila]|uniref:N-acetylmuramoyl-L-alanine amidase family protein n=1 Tax=Desulfitispora alkaliphila TaxID=622674 RepID=UPI003D225021
MTKKLLFLFPFLFAFIIVSINHTFDYYNVRSVTGGMVTQTVIIDPGHGGRDPGAVHENIHEKEIVLDISLRVRDNLEKRGITANMTRDIDTDLVSEEMKGSTRQQSSLLERLDISSSSEGEVLVSVHTNSSEDERFFGTQTYFKEGDSQGKLLAECIQAELKKVRMSSREAIPGSFYLLDHSDKPAVIVEVGFVSNEEDRRLLAQEKFRILLSEAIANGIEQYITAR